MVAGESETFDIVFVGGGLANTLCALRLADRRPELNICVLERDARLGGEHTWSFHTSDLTADLMQWIEPLITYSWDRQEVRFPQFTRLLDAGYNSISSSRLNDVGLEVLGSGVRLNARVKTINERNVFLVDSTEIRARCIVDGRGLMQSEHLALGHQSFLGLEVRLDEPHGQEHPIIMDATVDQLDGYRFVYTLPLSPDTVLIEDTYYNDTERFDDEAVENRIRAYAAARGWRIAEILRTEHGILPIVLAGRIDAFWDPIHSALPRTGLRAALFHPVTGYSLPDAVRLADLIASQETFETGAMAALIANHSRTLWRQRGFYRMLNRMLFIAASPGERVNVLQRFYRLPLPLIKRFYAGQTTLTDQMRILVGRPPVSIARALRSLPADAAWTFKSAAPGA